MTYDDYTVRKLFYSRFGFNYDDFFNNQEEFLRASQYLKDNGCSIQIYAYAWKTHSSLVNMALNCKPTLGVLKYDKYGTLSFYEYNKKGKLVKGLSSDKRLYADTKEEAVKGYNDLIDKYLEKLDKLKEWANSYRVLEEENDESSLR